VALRNLKGRKNLLVLAATFILGGAVIGVTWLASASLFALVLAVGFLAVGLTSLVAGLRRLAGIFDAAARLMDINDRPTLKRDVHHLAEALESESQHVRRAAQAALETDGVGRPATGPATAHLLSVLRDPEVHEASERVLVHIGAPAVPPLVRGTAEAAPGDRAARAHVVTAIGTPGVQSLVSALAEPSAYGPRACDVEALLEEVGGLAVEPLVTLLRSESADWHARSAAAGTLGRIGDPRAVEALVELLGSDSADLPVRQAAADSLGLIGDPRAVEPLIAALRTPGLAENAAGALGSIGDARAADAIFTAMQNPTGPDSTRETHRLAVELGRLGDPRAAEPLLDLLNDVDEEWRDAAASVIDRIDAPQARAAADKYKSERENARQLRESAGRLRQVAQEVATIPATFRNQMVALDAVPRQLLLNLVGTIVDTCEDAARALEQGRDGQGDAITPMQVAGGLRAMVSDVRADIQVVASRWDPGFAGLVSRHLDDIETVASQVTQGQAPGDAVGSPGGSGRWSGDAPLARELANFRELLREEATLLEDLTPVPEEIARSIFARVEIPEPNRYADAAAAFSGLRQYAASSQDAPVQLLHVMLAADGESGGSEFLYVHLADEALPLGFLVCALDGGGFLGHYKTGTQLQETLGLAASPAGLGPIHSTQDIPDTEIQPKATDDGDEDEVLLRVRSLIDELGSRRGDLTEPVAAKELVDLGEVAVPLLIENLTTSSYIPLILGEIGDPRAVDPLMTLARTRTRFASDPDAYSGYACEMALRGLGLLKDQRALPLLREIEATTDVGEIAQAAREAMDRLVVAATGRRPELEGLTDDQLERLAASESTPSETLDALAEDPSWRIRASVAMNPAISEQTIRKLAEQSDVHANLLVHPRCPSDVLTKIVEVGRARNARSQAERHPNWRG
jgi:HEAT repeat protein